MTERRSAIVQRLFVHEERSQSTGQSTGLGQVHSSCEPIAE
jgi:hypothetical protein